MRSVALGALLVVSGLALALPSTGSAPRASTTAGVVDHAAIASAHPLATEAGMLMLQKGGNSFDAAIAVSLSLIHI